VLLVLAQAGPVRDSAAPTVVEARLLPGGAFEVDLQTDLDALLLGLSPAAQALSRVLAMERLRREGRAGEAAAVARLGDLLRRRLRLRFDGEPAAFEISFPERRTLPGGDLVTLGPRVRLRGATPSGARAFTFFASRSFRGVELRTVAGERASRQVLEAGAESAPVALP